ncbi:MAG: HD domain-containing protein [Bacillota bacterium]|nr:HD domain-containing protein [Bacillota bacterium]
MLAADAGRLASRLMAGCPAVLGHCRRVASVAVLLASRAGFPAREVALLEAAALLHDAGKRLWPPSLREGSRPLAGRELALVRSHPADGAALVRRLWPSVPSRVLALIRQHHERRDGSGYPRGLAGDAVDPLAVLLGLADSWCAAQEPRLYRERVFSPEEALSEVTPGWWSWEVGLLRAVVVSGVLAAV